MPERGKHHQPRRWWWLGRGRQQVSRPRSVLGLLVDGDDTQAHQLTPESYEAGLRAGTGCYQVLCGRVIAAASMVTPPGRPCLSCQELGAGT